MKLYISPPSQTNWKILPDALASSLAAQYPRAQIEDLSKRAEGNVLEWVCQLPSGTVTGWLDRELNTFVLDGDIEDCARVAIWLRTIVPADQELAFYDEGYSADGELTLSTSNDDIAGLFLLGPTE